MCFVSRLEKRNKKFVMAILGITPQLCSKWPFWVSYNSVLIFVCLKLLSGVIWCVCYGKYCQDVTLHRTSCVENEKPEKSSRYIFLFIYSLVILYGGFSFLLAMMMQTCVTGLNLEMWIICFGLRFWGISNIRIIVMEIGRLANNANRIWDQFYTC